MESESLACDCKMRPLVTAASLDFSSDGEHYRLTPMRSLFIADRTTYGLTNTAN